MCPGILSKVCKTDNYFGQHQFHLWTNPMKMSANLKFTAAVFTNIKDDVCRCSKKWNKQHLLESTSTSIEVG